MSVRPEMMFGLEGTVIDAQQCRTEGGCRCVD